MATILEIILKTIKSGSGFRETEKDVSDLGKATATLNNILAGAGLAIGAKELFDYGAAAIQASREATAAQLELQTALTSTGQATAGYQQNLQALATDLENTTNFSDEMVQHAESVLLTFDKIGQETMPRATRAAADLAQLFGGGSSGLQAATVQLGKALQGQISALERSGVSFSDAQTTMIQSLFATGQESQAQAIILGQLEKQVQGQAAAARDAAGFQQNWAVATGNLSEAMGGLLLAIGDGGVGGASVGLLDTMTQSAGIWQQNVEQIGLLVDALNRANTATTGVDVAAQSYGAAVETVRQIQVGWEIVLTKAAHAAIESTVGWDALAESYGTVQEESQAAAQATEAANQAIAQTPPATGASAQALDALAARWQGLANAQRTMPHGRDVLGEMAGGKTFSADEAAAFADQQKEKERASREAAKQMTSSFKEAADQIGNIISGKLQTTFQDVFQLPEGAADQADEPARRLATVAAAGFGSEWLTQLNQQFSGQAFWQPMAAAIAAGDNGALQQAAVQTLQQFQQGLVPQLWDVEVIRAQVRAQMQQQNIREQLIEEVKAGLGTEGIAASIGAVQVAAGDTAAAQATVGAGAADMAQAAEGGAKKIGAAFTEALPAVDMMIQRITLLNKMLERTVVLAQQAAGAISGLNAPGGNGGGVPNDAQRALGGNSPL